MSNNSSSNGIIAVLSVVAVVTTGLIGAGSFLTYQSWKGMTDTVDQRLKTQDLQGKIIWLDEVLTMSARMTASTGDSSWETRYNEFVPMLDDAIAELTELTPVKSDAAEAKATDDANQRLIAAETKAFELTTAGNAGEAFNILMGAEYKKDKDILTAGMDNYNKSVNEFIQNKVDSETEKTNALFTMLLVSLAISFAAWVFAVSLIKRWGKGLQEMAASIEQKNDELKELNSGLEDKVAERTAELAVKTQRMSLIFKNAEQGFVMVSPEGKLGEERSAALDQWFPDWKADSNLSKNVENTDASIGTMFGIGWDQLMMQLLPTDLAVDQIPSQMEKDGNTYDLGLKPIVDEKDEIENVLLVVTDVSAKVAQEKLERESAEQMKSFRLILSDKNGFLEFVSETEKIVGTLGTTTQLSVLKRALHTIKGNSSIYGLLSIADACHEWESSLEENGLEDAQERSKSLNELWNARIQAVNEFIGNSDSAEIEIDREEYVTAIKTVRTGASTDELVELMNSWALESSRKRLSRVKSQAERFAERIEKPEIQVNVEHHFMRYHGEKFGDFWGAMIHVIRNALDHGIESAQEREETGKSSPGTLTLRTLPTDNGGMIVEVEDNGRGINWDAVAAKAKKHGVAHGSHKELVNALFTEGLSTRDVVNENSGRGVGLGAVKYAADELGGTIDVESKPGQGTTFRFVFPETVVGGTSIEQAA